MRSKYIYTKPTNETTKRRKEEKPKNLPICRLRLMKDSTPDHPFDSSIVFSSIFPLKKCNWMDWSSKISNHNLKIVFLALKTCFSKDRFAWRQNGFARRLQTVANHIFGSVRLARRAQNSPGGTHQNSKNSALFRP